MSKYEGYQIKNVKLVTKGEGGIETNYLKSENGKTHEFSVKEKFRVHSDLLKRFLQLRFHVVRICGLLGKDSLVTRDLLSDEDKKYLDEMIDNVFVSKIVFTGNNGVLVQLSATVTITEGKVYNVLTPRFTLDEEFYEKFKGEMFGIAEEIKIETLKYLFEGKNGEEEGLFEQPKEETEETQ